MARARTTKELAERIDLNYFKRPHPMRRWMRLMIVGAAVAAAGWLIVDAIGGGQRVYMPGPVSTGHAMFSQQCTQCHAPRDQGFYWRRVSDEACLRCHDGPRHHPNQTLIPHCASCHVEHRGGAQLASVPDRHCTQCHARLRTMGPSAHASDCLVKGHRIERRIDSFNHDHPEFAVLRTGYRDGAQIKLNHQVHLKRNLRGLPRLRGAPGVTEREGQLALACVYCHQPDSQRAYMAPIQYEKHCLACHALHFDARFPETVVPHQKLDVVIPFVQERFSQYILDHPEAMRRQQIEPVRRLPGRSRYQQLPRTPRAWVDQQVEDAKMLLLRKTCLECHIIVRQRGFPPTIASPAIPRRWLVHSVFSHAAHRALTCTACHQQVPTSQKTADVLLPGIHSCQQCHRQVAARASCVECHGYHDKRKERSLEGLFTIPRLLSGGASRPGGS